MGSALGPDRDLQSFRDGTALANERFGELRYPTAATSRSNTNGSHLPGRSWSQSWAFASAEPDQTQDRGIEAIRSGAGRDDHDQHEGIQSFRQIEPVIEPVGSIDRLECFDSLSP